MKSEWNTSAIANICKVVTDGSHTSPKSVSHGKYMVSVKDFTPYGFDFNGCRQISFADYEKLKSSGCVPQKGDILIGKDGARYFEDIIIYNQDEAPALLSSIAILRCDEEKVIPEYLYYLLKTPSFKKDVKDNYGSGSAIPRIILKDFKRMKVEYPSIEKQRQIVSILHDLDAKIFNNQKVNDNLEQQAAALFSSLYNRSNTEVRYTDLIQILGGGTPKTGETAYWNGNIAFFTPKDVGTPYTFITEKTITEEGLSHCNSRLYPVNTVFVTARGTVGKVGLSGVPMAMNQSCYALVGKETRQLLVYFYTLKAVDRLKHKASGAVFDAITTRDFDSEQIMKLSDDDAKAFLCVAEPMFQEILNNSIENLRLSTLRDFLLPKLMSGEIDVSSVQL
ncbi:restriction endonuclease subunit S [Faecalibacterium prausnitzii]|uniref:restriction endonuclease subunit S n=1 Tax=Faecalibacterium prausnitzii TaxID=853 RepID=UPI001F3BBBEA|nr:restriction endonuclease subunit S [Faecalibacterium prausnitzii]